MMKGMKAMSGKTVGKIIVAAVLVLILAGGAYLVLDRMENHDEFFYTQVDNSRIKELKSSSDDMKYEYSLESFDENGGQRELKFKTVRELREGAYLKLELRALGLVYSWEEVQLEDIPEKAREKLK